MKQQKQSPKTKRVYSKGNFNAKESCFKYGIYGNSHGDIHVQSKASSMLQAMGDSWVQRHLTNPDCVTFIVTDI